MMISSEVLQQLNREKYDYVMPTFITISVSLRVRTTLGVKSRTFNKLNVRKWLQVNFKMKVLPDVHIVQRYLETLAPLGVQYDGEGIDFFIDPADEVKLNTLPEPWRNGYAGFVIGAKHGTKTAASGDDHSDH